MYSFKGFSSWKIRRPGSSIWTNDGNKSCFKAIENIRSRIAWQRCLKRWRKKFLLICQPNDILRTFIRKITKPMHKKNPPIHWPPGVPLENKQRRRPQWSQLYHHCFPCTHIVWKQRPTQRHICRHTDTRPPRGSPGLWLRKIQPLPHFHIPVSQTPSHPESQHHCQLGPISPGQLCAPGRPQHHRAGISRAPELWLKPVRLHHQPSGTTAVKI